MRISLLLVFGCGLACSGRPPQQSGALGVFNPRGLEQRLTISAEMNSDESHRTSEKGSESRVMNHDTE